MLRRRIVKRSSLSLAVDNMRQFETGKAAMTAISELQNQYKTGMLFNCRPVQDSGV